MNTAHALVVDDDDSIRSILAMTLAELGYSVTEAQNTEEALRYVRGTSSTFQLIITDFSMPGTSGVALIRDVIAYSPDHLPILVLLTGTNLDVREIQDLRTDVNGR